LFVPGIVDVRQVIETTAVGLGYELVDVELANHGRQLRVFIDRPAEGAVEARPPGVTLADCERVTRQLQRVLEVEGVDYGRLEVSSPGLDRPLTKLADYARFAGEEAQLTLAAPVDGAKRVKGIVRGTEGDNVLVETAAGVRSFPFGTIGRARLVPRIDWRKGS
jgi:ribosome maturation factor RimP